MDEIDPTKFRLDEIKKIETYSHEEINQRKSCSKKLNKYVTAFNYIDKILIVLSATSGGVCIISFAAVGGALYFNFSLTTGIMKKLLSITRNKKKTHDKILMLAKSKLNSIETLISQALFDTDISHKKFITVLNEKDKYEKMKENVRNISEKLEKKQQNNSVNLRTTSL